MIKVITVDWGQSRLEGGGNVTAPVQSAQLTLDLSRAVGIVTDGLPRDGQLDEIGMERRAVIG